MKLHTLRAKSNLATLLFVNRLLQCFFGTPRGFFADGEGPKPEQNKKSESFLSLVCPHTALISIAQALLPPVQLSLGGHLGTRQRITVTHFTGLLHQGSAGKALPAQGTHAM